MLQSAYGLLSCFLLIIQLMNPLANTFLGRISALGSTFVVTSTADSPDADLGDGICLALNGACTLRAAIQQANFSAGADTINLPPGVFLITRIGNDDAAVLGDLDITDSLTIQGAGSASTIVDGNGAVTGDRVFQITSNAKETTLSGMTIRNGKKTASPFDEGGGIYWDGGGGHLHLKDITVTNNSASYGGGLYLNFSTMVESVDLDHLILHSNTATSAAGGLGVNFSDFATLNLHDSLVSSNSAYEGGGIYFQGTPSFNILSATIRSTQVFLNSASLSAGFENHSGNGAVPIQLQDSNLYQNQATSYGGAIGNYGSLNISTTTINLNTAATRGGGIYDYEGGKLDIKQSTLSRNSSQTGGGIYSEFVIHNNAVIVMTNSTVSSNSASKDGAGVYADGGQINLYNATVAENQILVPQGMTYLGSGGGVYLASRVGFSAQNSLIGDNFHQYGISLPVPDDCYGFVDSLGFDLVGLGTSNCTIFSITGGNIVGQNPQLGPLQNSFGSLVQGPLRGSPAIDAGQTPNCTDFNGAPILVDQRGVARPLGGRCDIGAVEFLPNELFLPNLQR